MAQQELFINYIRETEKYQHWYPVFYIMLNTGMRVGELTVLRWRDVDFENGMIMAAQIKALFRKNHVYITSENENDIRFCRNLFFSVKRKNARTS